MKAKLLPLFFCMLVIGCESEQDSASALPDKDDETTIDVDPLDKMTEWLIDGYASIEKSFAKAESDFRKTDRPSGEVLSELASIVSALAMEAQAKEKELMVIKEEFSSKRDEFDQLASSVPPSERGLIEGELFNVEEAIELKIYPMENFDIPCFEKFDSKLKDTMPRWESSFSIFRDTKADTARGKLADLISVHFRENLERIINERKAYWGNGIIPPSIVGGGDVSTSVLSQEQAEADFKRTQRLAALGNAVAQNSLALLYRNGEDYSEAVKWYTKSAEQRYAPAQYNLARMYQNGNGVAEDHKEAVKWYTKSAEQGYAKAQYNLGLMYKLGEGVTQDYRQAHKWYAKSGEQGFPMAQYSLGWMYQNGKGVAEDHEEAVKWYRLAAEQGDAIAQSMLGASYGNGIGVAKDLIKGYAWYNIAIANGQRGDRKRRDQLKLTSEQLEEAQVLTSDIQRRIEANGKD